MVASYIDFVEERLDIGIDYGVVGGHELQNRNYQFWRRSGTA